MKLIAVTEKFDETEELTDEINHDDLTSYFTGIYARKRFTDFNNGIELFRKIKYGQKKLAEAKKLQKMLKSNLNEIARGRYK